MITPKSLGTALLGRTIEVGENRYRLLKPLGSGATAVVFLGEKIGDSVTQQRYAVKVTIEQETAKKERDNLLSLAQEQHSDDDFFPILHYPKSKNDPLEKSFYIVGAEGRLTTFVLVQEYVQAESVRDLLLRFPDTLALPEPLALDIAHQYVAMLKISHKARITSWDRKLGDLRWAWAEESPSYAPQDIFQRWRQGKIGNLKVLDWNVTHEVTPDDKAKDIFRLGLLWHRMLLGVEPKFRSGTETWQLLEPLESHAAWQTLSFGVQRILKKLLHPAPEKRYQDTEQLAGDMDALIVGWKDDSKELWDKIASVYNSISSSTRNQIQNAMALVSILDLRKRVYGDDIKNLPIDNALTSLKSALRLDNDFSLKNMIGENDWDKALGRIGVLFAGADNPIDVLLRRRYEFVLEKARASSWEKNEYAQNLITYSNSIYHFDLSNDTERPAKLNKEIVDEWEKALAPTNSGENWKNVHKAFVDAAKYRLYITEGHGDYANGRYIEAQEKLGQAKKLRVSIAVISNRHLDLLDTVWGNPEDLLEDVNKILEEMGKRKDVLKEGIQALLTGTKEAVEKPVERLQAFLYSAPRDVLVGELLYLLENWRSYLATDDLAMNLILLPKAEDAWKKFEENARSDKDVTSEQVKEVNEVFAKSWEELKSKILSIHLRRRNDDTPAPLAGEKDDQPDQINYPEEQGWRSGLLCRMYEDGAPGDKKIEKQVKRYLNKLKNMLSELSLIDDGFTFNEDNAGNVLAIAAWGQAFAQAWGNPDLWDTKLSVNELQAEFETLRKDAHEKSLLRSIYLTSILSFDPELWEEKA